jgi:hypothetical protein
MREKAGEEERGGEERGEGRWRPRLWSGPVMWNVEERSDNESGLAACDRSFFARCRPANFVAAMLAESMGDAKGWSVDSCED